MQCRAAAWAVSLRVRTLDVWCGILESEGSCICIEMQGFPQDFGIASHVETVVAGHVP